MQQLMAEIMIVANGPAESWSCVREGRRLVLLVAVIQQRAGHSLQLDKCLKHD